MMTKPLSNLRPSEKGRINKVGGRGGIRRRLLDMGVVPGALVEVRRVAPLGDPIEIRVMGYSLALRKEEAEHIQVSLTEFLLCEAVAGEMVTVETVRAGWGLQRRLNDLGITPGVQVKVISGGRSGHLVLDVRGSRLALGRGVAGKIIVKDEIGRE